MLAWLIMLGFQIGFVLFGLAALLTSILYFVIIWEAIHDDN